MVEIKENDCLLFGKNLQEACSLFLAQRQPLVCVHHKAGADSPWGFVQNLPAKQREGNSGPPVLGELPCAGLDQH